MEVPSYFRRYLTNIQPTRANRALAIRLHSTLRAKLAADEAFADEFGGSFLYGSYRRNTAVQPIKDGDICVLLTVDRADSEHTPERVVRRLREVLKRNGYEDKTALQRRSVRVEMSGMDLDVVPVVACDEDGEDGPLWIPDRPLEEWVTTHPKGHLAAATELNRACNRRYIPLVKIVKAWHRHRRAGEVRPKPKGFTLEALVAHFHDPRATSYAAAFTTFLDRLWAACGTDLAAGAFPAVPDPGRDGEFLRLTIDPGEAKRFGEIVEASLADATAALAADTIRASAHAWHHLLGPQFPTVPETMTESEARKADEQEGGEEPDEEILEIDLRESALQGGVTSPSIVRRGPSDVRHAEPFA